MWKRTRLIVAAVLTGYSFFAKSPPAHRLHWITSGTGRLFLLLAAVLIFQWDSIREGAPALWNRIRGRGVINELQKSRRELSLIAAECREPGATVDYAQWEYSNAVHSVTRFLRLHAPQHLVFWRTSGPTWDPLLITPQTIATELDFAVTQLDTIIAALRKKR